MSTPTNPTAFVAYAHDSPEHKNGVLRLAELLMDSGVKTELDQWAEGPRQDWYGWAHDHITGSDFTIVVASARMKVVGDGSGPGDRNQGAQAEMAVVRDLLQRDRAGWTPRLLPVVLPGDSIDDIPDFLQPYAADHYVLPELTPAGVEDLVRVITRQPKRLRPPLGPVPTLPPRPPATHLEPRWRVLPAAVPVTWRSEIMDIGHGMFARWPGTLEVHLAPTGGDARLPMGRLRAVGEGLVLFARNQRLVSAEEPVEAVSTDQGAWVASRNAFRGLAGGVALLRDGQRSAWLGLPRGRIGSVLIRDEAVDKVTRLVSALLALDAPLPHAMVPTAGIDPVSLVRVGEVSDLTSNVGSLTMNPRNQIRLPAEEWLTVAEINGHTAAVATELVERLLATFGQSAPVRPFGR